MSEVIYTVCIANITDYNIKGLSSPFIVKVTNGITNGNVYHIILKGKSVRSNKAKMRKLIRKIKRAGGKVEIINWISNR